MRKAHGRSLFFIIRSVYKSVRYKIWALRFTPLRLCLLLWVLFLGLTAQADIRLTDVTGTELVLERPAQRIVALAPHIVENVFRAGAGDQLVGVVSYSDYPEQAKTLAVIGNYQHLNQESLLALAPDVVLAWGSGNGAAMIKRLRDLGIKVYVYEPKTIQDVALALRTIGQIAGTQQQADREATRYLQTMAQLAQRYEAADPISVLYQVWNSPLQTLNDDHIISDVMRLCGGKNVFGQATMLAPVISREAVLIENPQVILASGMGQSRPQWLDEWQQWPSLQAVRANQLYHIPPDHIQRHTTRLALGAAQICQALDEARQYYGGFAVQE